MSELTDRVREIIKEEVSEGWPGARLREDRQEGEKHRFQISADGEHYSLVLGGRVIFQDDVEAVVELLRDSAWKWIALLREDGCVQVGMSDNTPILERCPD